MRQATAAEAAARAATEVAAATGEGLEAARQATACLEAALDSREGKLRDSWHALRAQLADLAGDAMLMVPHSDASLAVCITGVLDSSH